MNGVNHLTNQPSPAAGCSAAAPPASATWPWPALLRGRRRAAAAGPARPQAAAFPAAGQAVIFLFMHGGPSQVDTFDPKPLLDATTASRSRSASRIRVPRHRQPARLALEVQKYGRAGTAGQRAVPARRATRRRPLRRPLAARLEPGPRRRPPQAAHRQRQLHPPEPRRWVSYGLGTENHDLPGFITLCPTLIHGGVQNYGVGLPARRLPGHLHRQPAHRRR